MPNCAPGGGVGGGGSTIDVTPGWASAAATAVGEWLVSQARPRDSRTTWYVYEHVPGSRPTRRERRLAGGSLYRGTAGIGLFLSELGRVCGRAEFLDVARGAIWHAIGEKMDRNHLRPSFYSGETGTVFAAATYLRCHEDKTLQSEALALLEALMNSAHVGDAFDLIGGAAGTIVGLLGSMDVFGCDFILPFCERLGEHLIDTAHVEPQGLSWGKGPARGANLCGLGHGAAGVGWALLELYQHTGRTCFRVAAEEAFAYEESHFDGVVENWPDFRNLDLTDLQFEARLDELDEMVERGEPVPLYERRFMTAWCHGAAGIGLSRVRAHELLGGARYRSSIDSALRSTIRTLVPRANDSLCHGLIGNAMAALAMARRLGRKQAEYRILSLMRFVSRSVQEAGGRWIPGGAERGQADPTLMLGEAGVGLALLSLEHDVASALLPVPASPARSLEILDDAELVTEKITLHAFPECTRVLVADGGGAWARLGSHERTEASTVDCLAEAVAALAVSDSELAKALAMDRMLLDRARRGFDRSYSILRRHFPASGFQDEPLALAPWIEVARCNDMTWLLFPDDRGVWHTRRLTSQVQALLECCRTPSPPWAATEAIAACSGMEPERIAPWVREQMDALAQAGVLISGRLSDALAVGLGQDEVTT